MRNHSAEHKKKMIAPVISAMLFLAGLIVYAVMTVSVAGWHPVMILPALVLIAVGIGMVYTLRSRIKEIRSGEEDDLDNY